MDTDAWPPSGPEEEPLSEWEESRLKSYVHDRLMPLLRRAQALKKQGEGGGPLEALIKELNGNGHGAH